MGSRGPNEGERANVYRSLISKQHPTSLGKARSDPEHKAVKRGVDSEYFELLPLLIVIVLGASDELCQKRNRQTVSLCMNALQKRCAAVQRGFCAEIVNCVWNGFRCRIYGPPLIMR